MIKGVSRLLRFPVWAVPVLLCAAPDAARAAFLEERPDLKSLFAEHGTPGTFVLYDVSGDRIVAVDGARAQRRFIPASTFKIVNSLIALETGAVKDESEVVPYGGGPQPFPRWERDMNLRDAIRASNVPVYQEVARRIGLARMRPLVEKLGYGNGRVGSVVDRFWLDGPLEISALEQAIFLARLARGRLPLSARSQSVVREILRLEQTREASLFGKTGWVFGRTPQLGWWVGWVEREGRIHAFALNIDMASADDAGKRVTLGRLMLERLGVLRAGKIPKATRR